MKNGCAILLSTVLVSHLSSSFVQGANCPGNLTDRADVQLSTPGNDYDVYYTLNSMSSDFFPAVNAGWVQNALFTSHNAHVNNGFRNPFFGATPNDTCIFAGAPAWADAPSNNIRINAPSVAMLTEPFTRAVVNHELFHHVQYAYINAGEWASWGQWTVEATAALMEDKSFMDLDNNAMNCRYVGDVRFALNTPNTTLMSRVYDGSLFWNYVSEQVGGAAVEPARGVDAVRGFWQRTSGNSPDSIRYLRETINAGAPGRSLEDFYLDFSVANFVHNLNLNALPPAQRVRYRYIDESPPGTPYGNVARTQIFASEFNRAFDTNVVRWGAQYFLANVPSDIGCEAVGVVAKARDSKVLAWALVTLRGGNVVEIYRSVGNEFYRTFLSNPLNPYSQMALIAVGLNDSADFVYAFGSGQTSGDIIQPTPARQAIAGNRNDPRRFQVRLRVLGPSMLTPLGSGPMSVKGLNPLLFTGGLRSSSSGTLYPATIVNATYVSGEYWMVVAAPRITNPADGDLYDLEICVCVAGFDCALQLRSPRSVLYAETQLNQMLVLDRSFSMHYPEPALNSKIEAAKNATRMYVDAAADNDRLGLVTFTGDNIECNLDANVDRPLLRMQDGAIDNRRPLTNAIGAVVEAGWTSIGDGIKLARDAIFLAVPPPGPREVNNLILLSDGWENEGDFWAKPNPCGTPFVRDSFDRVTGSAASMAIDTIAFGPNANAELLQRIAGFASGTFYAVSSDPPAGGSAGGISLAAFSQNAPPPPSSPPTMASLQVPNRLAHVYRSAQEQAHDEDRLYFRAHSLSAGSTSLVVPVTEHTGGGVQNATFTFNWHLKSVNVQITLFDPNGNEITPATPGWTVFQDATHKIYHFNGTLPPGDYAVSANSSGNVQLLTMLSGLLIHGVSFDIYLSQAPGLPPSIECDLERVYDYLRGLPVDISANLNDFQGGISGLQLEAVVENPDGLVNRLSLYDDGLHDDGLEGDGIYANHYTRTPFFSRGGVPDFPGLPAGQWGSYAVHVFARGTSHSGDPFERSGTRFFQVYEFDEQFRPCDPDLDNDGLPDRWEDLYGLNKADPLDADLDPDRDGLSNRDEFHFGTLPLNPDTDGGGEADGSEVAQGRDPLYDKDDVLPAIIDYGVVTHVFDIPIHYPEPNTAILHFPVNTAYRFMEIWRTGVFPGAFNLVARVDLTGNRSGIYYDRGLANDVPYDYYLVAEGHRWDPLESTCRHASLSIL